MLVIFFTRFILYVFFSHFRSFMVVCRAGFWGWVLELGFWGWGFQLMGFGACGVRPSGVLWLGLFILTFKNDPGKKNFALWKVALCYRLLRSWRWVATSYHLTFENYMCKTGDKVKTHCR